MSDWTDISVRKRFPACPSWQLSQNAPPPGTAGKKTNKLLLGVETTSCGSLTIIRLCLAVVCLCVFAVVLRGACHAEDHLCLCCHVEDYQGDHVPVAMSCLVPVCFVFLCLVYQSLSAASWLVCLMPLCYIPVSCAPPPLHPPTPPPFL